MRFQKLTKRLFIIFKSNWLLSLFKGHVLSFASYEIMNNTKSMIGSLTTIIDVGANKGQFQKAAAYFYPHAKIFSFEPIPELYRELEKKNSPNIKNFNFAFGEEKTVLEFNKNKYSPSSSFLEVHQKNDNFPSTEVSKIDIEIDTLDNFFKEIEINSKSILKIDVQGFELKVLKGGISTIKNKIDYIIIESNFEELYEDQPDFTDLNLFLNQNNFYLKSLLDFNFGKRGNYIEADFLYKKITNRTSSLEKSYNNRH